MSVCLILVVFPHRQISLLSVLSCVPRNSKHFNIFHFCFKVFGVFRISLRCRFRAEVPHVSYLNMWTLSTHRNAERPNGAWQLAEPNSPCLFSEILILVWFNAVLFIKCCSPRTKISSVVGRIHYQCTIYLIFLRCSSRYGIALLVAVCCQTAKDLTKDTLMHWHMAFVAPLPTWAAIDKTTFIVFNVCIYYCWWHIGDGVFM